MYKGQKNAVIIAAAGSGKTAVLVERIIRRFCDEESPLMADRALIVTFTNAAADELKTKALQLFSSITSNIVSVESMLFL